MLRLPFWRGRLFPNIGQNWEPVGVEGGSYPNQARLVAKPVLRSSFLAHSSLRFDTPMPLERIGRFTGPELLPVLRGICVDGETVVLPEDVFGAAFTIGKVMQRMPDGSEIEIQELRIRK